MEASESTTAQPVRARRRNWPQLTLGLLVGVIVTLFAVLNLGDVKVNWIVGSWSTPLIVVIVVCVLVGAVLDRILIAVMRRRRRAAAKQA